MLDKDVLERLEQLVTDIQDAVEEITETSRAAEAAIADLRRALDEPP